MDEKREAQSTVSKAEPVNDVYEFKSSGKEENKQSNATAAGAPVGNQQDTSSNSQALGSAAMDKPNPEVSVSKEKENQGDAGEKRVLEEEEDESRKRRKKEELPKETKPSRNTRGNSSEKATATSSVAKVSNKGKLGSTDRKSPVQATGSASNSPKSKAVKAAEHSDSEDDDNTSKKSSDSSGLKVPPLKIVLTSNANSSENDAKKAKDATEEDDQKAGSSNSQQKYTVNDDEENSVDCDEKAGGPAAGGPSRVTRSRANQSTPGPGEVSGTSDQGGVSSDGNGGNTFNPQGSSSNVTEKSEKSNYTEYHVKKRKLRSQVEEEKNSGGGSQGGSGTNSGRGNSMGNSSGGTGPSSGTNQGSSGTGAFAGNNASNHNSMNGFEPINDIIKFRNIRKQIEQRRKNLFPVHPKPPQGYRDYLMNRKTYLLQSNANERLRSMPMIQPPPSLDGPLKQLFIEQEKERHMLRKRHLVEKEKLVLTVEQEIIRVHGRAARALANQPFPYSVCTILRDEEIYTPIDSQQEEKNRDIRSRYNGRLFLSWLQDVDDKWEKIKEQMVLRHHNEAESLNAVQKMDWEWKVNELAGANSSDNVSLKVDDLYIPMVHVSDDFDLSDNR